MSDTGMLGELLRSRIVQCDALEQEVERLRRRHARALGVAEGMSHRVTALESELRAAKADAWDEGVTATMNGVISRESSKTIRDRNPYRRSA